MKSRAVVFAVGSILLLVSPVRAAEPAAAPATTEAVASPASDEWTLGAVRRLALAAQLGVHHRLNDPPAFFADERNALGGGLELHAYMARRFAVTLGWERFGVGSEISGITRYGTASVDRRADGVWLGLRIAPWANAHVSTFVAMAVGAAWQHASARGVLWPEFQPGLAEPVACRGTGSPAPSMRVELGLEAPVGDAVSVFASGGFGVNGFGDGPVGDCVSGAGSTELVSGRVGFAYAFDVGGGGG